MMIAPPRFAPSTSADSLDENKAAATPRRRYQRPRLEHLGSLTERTQNAGNLDFDAFFLGTEGQQVLPPPDEQ
ncbi:MAG: hypothetical protein AAGD01_06755 [Acidobacteriota bacterium]